jgi:anaerobic selenocysteine-containing dehydrogenase
MTPMDRRRFLKVTAVTGAAATLAQCGSPENHLIRFVPEDEITPGIAVWKPSVCPLCRAGCGVLARVMDGDAEVFRNGQPGVIRMGLVKKLEGDPDDLVSQGRLCVRGQAALQITYHPDRLTGPLKRTGPRGSGEYQAVSWDEALAELVGQLDALAGADETSSLTFLARPGNTRRLALAAEFARRFGAPPPVTYEVFDDAVLREANRISFGAHQLPTLDLAAARYVVVFGADLLGTWNSPVAQNAAYGRMRQGRAGVRGKLVQVEPRMSLTGASADEWVPVRPGTEGVLALGLAHVMLASGLREASAAGRAGALIDGWSRGLAAFTPAEVERQTGVPAARVERLAREFAEHGPSIAVIGGAPLAHTNGLFQALAVNALNALVGNIGVAGGLSFTTRPSPPPPTRSLRVWLESPSRVLLLDGANAVHGTPAAWRVADRIREVPFVASFGSFLDDTSVLADLILPDHSFLESWVEATPESGTAAATSRLAGPAMRPLYETRAMPDVLLDVARRLATPLTPALPWQTFEELLQTPAEATTTVSTAAAPPATTRPAVAASAPAFDGDAAAFPFHFLPYSSQALLDGSLAHLPWLQELPDPLTTAMWCSWVEINPQTAARLGIADADMVEVRSAHGSVRAPAVLSPGIAPDVVAMPAGQGHGRFTRYASGRGANPIAILAPVVEAETGALAWAATRVNVTRVGGTDGTLIRFAGATRERPDVAHGR